jgi:hypothetical protein
METRNRMVVSAYNVREERRPFNYTKEYYTGVRGITAHQEVLRMDTVSEGQTLLGDDRMDMLSHIPSTTINDEYRSSEDAMPVRPIDTIKSNNDK